MNNNKFGLVRSTLVYTLSDGICHGLSFLLLPLVSYYIIPAELGIAANFDVLQSILTLLAGKVIVNGLPYFYYDRTKEDLGILLSNLILIILASNLLFTFIIVGFTSVFDNYLHIGLGLQLLTIFSGIAQLVSSINLILYRLEEKPFSFAILQILQTIIMLTLVYFLVVDLKMGAKGKIYSSVFATIFLSIVHIILLFKRKLIIFKFSGKTIKNLLSFGVPLLPHSLSFWIKSGLDKIMLTSFCGLATNGLYSMAISFGGIYTIFNTAFSNAYVPYLQNRISQMKPETAVEEKKKLVRLSYLIGIVFFILFFMSVLICYLAIEYVLNEKYKDSFQFIPCILLSVTINAFYGLVIQYPYTIKKTMGLGIITFSSSIIQFLLTFFLLKTIGSNGINYSLVIGSLLTLAGVWWYSNKVYPMPWLTFWSNRKEPK